MKQLFEGSITKVHGIRVGQAQNDAAKTGVTVVLCSHDGAVMGADVRGAAPGTRETDLCKPENTVERVNAVVLSGGSAYGLDSASGVMRFLEEHGAGVDMGVCKVPIVPAAVLFDLKVGDAHVRPDAAMGYEACEKAGKEVRQGAFGAGSITLGCGVTVGAIVAVNACGDVYEANTDKVLACGHLADGKPVLCENLLYGSAPIPEMLKIGTPSGQNTTIGVVATDAVLTKAQALRMATCAHDGYARTIRPVHTQMDGDTVFALGTGRIDADVNPVQLCAAAAEVTARAIQNALWAVQHP